MRYGVVCRVLVILAFCSCLAYLSRNTVHGQELDMPNLASQWLDGVRVTPVVQAGFQSIGLNFDMPVFIPNPIAPPTESLSLQLKDANVWVGGIGFTAFFPSSATLSIVGKANAQRNVEVFTPLDSQGQNLGVVWTGKRLQWWTIDANVGYPVSDSWSALAGVRREQVSVGLVNPRYAGDGPINFYSDDIDMFSEQIQLLEYFGDVSSKLWIPYVGMSLNGPNYRFRVLWSPFVSANVQIPSTVFNHSSVQQFFGSNDFSTDALNFGIEYKVLKPASFVEADLTYDVGISSTVSVHLWGTANWVTLRGGGKVHMAGTDASFVNGVPNPSYRTDVEGSAHASFDRRILAGGLDATLSF